MSEKTKLTEQLAQLVQLREAYRVQIRQLVNQMMEVHRQIAEIEKLLHPQQN